MHRAKEITWEFFYNKKDQNQEEIRKVLCSNKWLDSASKDAEETLLLGMLATAQKENG